MPDLSRGEDSVPIRKCEGPDGLQTLCQPKEVIKSWDQTVSTFTQYLFGLYINLIISRLF